MTFGIGFLIVLMASTAYAIGRIIYERLRPSPVVEEPPVILFADAVRLAGQVAKTRFIDECDTKAIVLPRNPDGTVATMERATHPGAKTVDIQSRQATGRHAAARPLTEAA